MKRELKAHIMWSLPDSTVSCSPNPYEEGTESIADTSGAHAASGCSPNPYEEGTESVVIFAQTAGVDALQPKSL
mgnify:FL=1